MSPVQLRSEQIVLCSLLSNPKNVHDIMTRVSEDMFQDNKHKVIFRAAVELYVNQETVNTISVSKCVLKQNTMYRMDAQIEVVNITGKFGLVSGLELDSSIMYLVSESIKDEHHDLGSKIISMANSDTYDPKEVLDVIQGHIHENKFRSLLKRKEKTNSDLIDEIKDQMDKARTKGGISGLETGYQELDEIIGGAQPTNLIIIAARPAMGKTQFALGIADHASLKGDKSGIIFSCEMADNQIAKRLICVNGGIRGYSIKFGNLNREEHLAWIKSSDRFTNSRCKILSSSWSIDDLVAKAHEISNKEGLDYLIVDYIQLVAAKGTGNKNSDVEEVTNKLKQLANELEIPVFALSQLSRAVEQRPDKKPMLSDLRDSGAIEQDADIVGFLYRPVYYMSHNERDTHPMKDDGYLIIAKHRDGELSDILMRFDSDIPAWRNKNDRIIAPAVQEEMSFRPLQPNREFDNQNDESPF